MIIMGYVLALVYGAIIIGLGALLFKLGVHKNLTRKFVHILIGFEWVILYIFFGSGIHSFAVAAAFTLLLAIEYKRKLLPMMSSEEDNAPGTVFYGISMTVMSFVCLFIPKMLYPFGIAVFCTSFGDGFAGVLGGIKCKINPKIFGNKTLFGSLANFIFSALTFHLFSVIFELDISPVMIISAALFCVGVENIFTKGLDNIFLPLSIFVLSFFIIYNPALINYIVPIALTPLIIAVAYHKCILTFGGVVLAFSLDVIVSLTLGNDGFIILLSFLLFGTAVDIIKKLGGRSKNKEGRECRNGIQVISNGFVAMLAAILFLVSREKVFVLIYVTALAEAFSDTVASGIGSFSSKVFDIFRMKRVKSGLSGGMSLIGTVSALAASFLFCAQACLLFDFNLSEYLLVSRCAFIGVIFDSALGSLLQVKYICDECGEITEQPYHCNKTARKYSGVRFITNDAVNLLSTLFSAGLCLLLSLLYRI